MPGTDYDSAINVHPLIELHVFAALFCFVFFPVRRIMPNFSLENKNALIAGRDKLFKSPVVRETISIIQKTFLPTGVSYVSLLSQIKISLHTNLQNAL